MTTQKTTPWINDWNCWFLNEPFRQDTVYRQLIRMNFKYVLGLDIGHGETVVYLAVMKTRVLEDKTVEVYPDISKIPVNSAGDSRIAAMIGFTGEKTIIGREARKIPGFYQHFKVEPARWEDLYRNRPFGELMGAYIRELWNGIKQYNPKVEQAAENGELLIAVGCPSCPAWTGEEAVAKYQELIMKATGCPHVTVLAESTAAIMSAVLDVNEISKEKSIRMNRGLAVIDAGSSTIDFTYVLLGKKLITRSLPVAGRALDEQILAAAMESRKTADLSVPEEQIPDLMVQIRQIKEEFYPDQLSLGLKNLQIWGRNAQGQADKDVDSGVYLQFTANAELMERALNRQTVQLDPFKPVMSWAQQCRNFIRDCRALIGDDEEDKILCDKVILTGGTSKVQLLRDIVGEEYPDCEILYSRDSSASVAKGLCYAKCMEIKGGSAVEEYRNDTDKLAENGYNAFVKDLSCYMANQVCDDIRCVVDKHTASKEKITAGALLDEINKRVRDNEDLSGEGCRKKMEELFVKHFQSAQEELHSKANVVSKSIYGADVSSVPEIPPLTQEELNQMASKLDIAATIGDTWLSTIVGSINFEAIRNVLLVLTLATGTTPLGPVFAALTVLSDIEGVQNAIMQFVVKNKTKIPRWMMISIAQSVTEPKKREKLESNSSRKTANNMKEHKILRNEFITSVTRQAEIVIGKVLFMVYEEKPLTE